MSAVDAGVLNAESIVMRIKSPALSEPVRGSLMVTFYPVELHVKLLHVAELP